MKKIWHQVIPFLAVMVIMGLIAFGSQQNIPLLDYEGSLRRLDRWAQDRLYQHGGIPSTDIVVIGIDDETFEHLGPFDGTNYRVWIGFALSRLASNPANRPAAVAIDVLFEGEGSNSGNNQLLAYYAEQLGCVVTATTAQYGDNIEWGEDGHARSRQSGIVDYIQPFDALRDATTQGHINAMLDTDGILRHSLLYVEPDGSRVYSMAVETARKYMDSKGMTLRLPDVSGTAGHFYVPFTGHPGDYSNGHSLYQLIDPAYWLNGEGTEDDLIPPELLAGKIVLIGPYAAGLQDAYYTPISRADPMYGVEYQANVIQCLLEGNYKTEVPDWIQFLAVTAVCLAAAWFIFHRKTLISAIISACLILMGFAGAYLFYLGGLIVHVLWLPLAAALLFLLALVYHYLQSVQERRALELEKQRIVTELALATRIQSNYLPKTFPERREFNLCASMTPAKEVGGDLYDFFDIDEDHLCLVIGDVSGKGVPASLFMMLASALIHHVAKRETSPAKILTQVNAEICSRNPEQMFVTVWLGVLQLSTGILTAANAGHEYPVLKQPDGSFELIKDRHGFVLGGMDGIRYREYTLQLEPGARLFVYTDGIPEATNASEEMFGMDRTLEALRRKENGSPREILEEVSRSVDTFVGEAQHFDDLTMLCVAYNGPSAT